MESLTRSNPEWTIPHGDYRAGVEAQYRRTPSRWWQHILSLCVRTPQINKLDVLLVSSAFTLIFILKNKRVKTESFFNV